MYDLSCLFRPITANYGSESHLEVLPCSILQPFIRCYWGLLSKNSEDSYHCLIPHNDIVIPDACLDIIFEIDEITNQIESVFCGINTVPFFSQTKSNPNISIFAIRFYFWSAYLFSDTNMRHTLNSFLNIEEYFGSLKKEFEQILEENKHFQDRICQIETLLIKRLMSKKRLNDPFQNAVYCLLKAKGVITVSELGKQACISNRQLERLFFEYTGASPKKIADIVRFQNVLQDLYLNRNCNQQDIIFEYKFYDQSHLINDFKKYTGTTPLILFNK